MTDPEWLARDGGAGGTQSRESLLDQVDQPPGAEPLDWREGAVDEHGGKEEVALLYGTQRVRELLRDLGTLDVIELHLNPVAVAAVEPGGGDVRDLFLRPLRPSAATETGDAAHA